MSTQSPYHTTDWLAIQKLAKPCEADAEVELIIAQSWQEIVEEARLKEAEGKAQILRTAWPRTSVK